MQSSDVRILKTYAARRWLVLLLTFGISLLKFYTMLILFLISLHVFMKFCFGKICHNHIGGVNNMKKHICLLSTWCLLALLLFLTGHAIAESNIKGDVNLDGKITSTDSLQLKEYLVHKRTLSDQAFKNADINEDGSITTTDLLQLNKLIVEIDDDNSGRNNPQNSMIKRFQSINVEYNTVSSRYTIGAGKEMGFILSLPDGHPNMDIQICSAEGDLELVFYGYNEDILWESAPNFGFNTIAVLDGNVESFSCGSNVKYILVYHLMQYKNSKPVKTATFWYQGAIQSYNNLGVPLTDAHEQNTYSPSMYSEPDLQGGDGIF